jgi:UDPglucose 6-dehydrogenase
VPGPDGKFGYGGACFPKDTEALAVIAKQADIDMTMLETAICTNKQLNVIP